MLKIMSILLSVVVLVIVFNKKECYVQPESKKVEYYSYYTQPRSYFMQPQLYPQQQPYYQPQQNRIIVDQFGRIIYIY